MRKIIPITFHIIIRARQPFFLENRDSTKDTNNGATECRGGRRFLRFAFNFFFIALTRAGVSAHLAGFGIRRCDVTRRMRYVTGLSRNASGNGWNWRGRSWSVPTTQAVPPDMPVASFGTRVERAVSSRLDYVYERIARAWL